MQRTKLEKRIKISNLNEIIKNNFKYFGSSKNYIDCFVSNKKNIPNSLSFIEDDEKIDFSKFKGTIILKKKNINLKSQIIYSNPRWLFVKLLNYFFEKEIDLIHYPKKNYLAEKSIYFKKNKITFSNNLFIGKNVKIGKNSFIGRNVVIYPNTILGKNIKILDNSVIGCFGLGYLKNKLLMPHLGKVIIKDNVNIGANCTIVRGTLDNTVIQKNVKIANNINIGHNVIIEKNCLLSSSVTIAGGARIKENTKIGVGANIKNNIIVGKNSQIAIGSVVVKNLKKNSSVFGNPSRHINLTKRIL